MFLMSHDALNQSSMNRKFPFKSDWSIRNAYFEKKILWSVAASKEMTRVGIS